MNTHDFDENSVESDEPRALHGRTALLEVLAGFISSAKAEMLQRFRCILSYKGDFHCIYCHTRAIFTLYIVILGRFPLLRRRSSGRPAGPSASSATGPWSLACVGCTLFERVSDPLAQHPARFEACFKSSVSSALAIAVD